jgi:hypothetical protein
LKTYIVNPKIVSLFLNVEENDPKVDQFMAEYLVRIRELYIKTVKEYYQVVLEYDPLKVNELVNNLADGENDPELDEEPVFLAKYQFSENQYNGLVYKRYAGILSQEQKDKINSFLREVQSATNEEFEKTKKKFLDALDREEVEVRSASDIQNTNKEQNDFVLPDIDEVDKTDTIVRANVSQLVSTQSQPPIPNTQIPNPQTLPQQSQLPQQTSAPDTQAPNSKYQIPDQLNSKSQIQNSGQQLDTSEATIEQESRPVAPPQQVPQEQRMPPQVAPQSPVGETPNMQSL